MSLHFRLCCAHSLHFYRRLPYLAVGGLAAMLVGDVRALADEAPHGSVCEIAAGLQGRIENIFASSGAAPRLQVERGGRLYPAKAGCFLLAGDIVRTRPGVTAVISLPEGGSAQADFDHPLVVPNVNRPNYLQSVIEVLREIVGANGEKARSPVTGQVEMRAADDDEPGPLLIPGISGVDGLGRQSVVREAPLVIRWSGGASPFRVRLVWGEGDQFVDLKGGPERFARMDVHNARSGPAEVRILSSDGKETRIGINLASKANRPLDSKASQSMDPETRSLVEASWLLTNGGVQWRLEALSELQVLALDHKNILARALLDPKAAPDETSK